ncbi:MAG: nitroreductase family protein [Chloroflexi bacterium]|nr:nitroreductase family protein [Chloroflexota bacterium]
MAQKMSIDEFMRLVRSRRSCRKFKTDPVPDEMVEKILEAGRWAMSGGNGQPWEFVVIRDQAIKDRIADLFMNHRERVYQIERTRVKELRMPAYYEKPERKAPPLKNAPVIIAMLGDKRTKQSSVLSSHFFFGEGGPFAGYWKAMANATQIMHLAAAAQGLGSQWVTVNKGWEESLKAILEVPEELDIQTLIPIGYPDYKAPPPYRRKLSDIVHHDKYDHSKFRDGEAIYNWLLELRNRTEKSYEHGV